MPQLDRLTRMHAPSKPAGEQTIDWRVAVEAMLGEHFGTSLPLVGIERQPFAFQTSAAIESFDVELADGTRLRLLLKDLSRAGLQPAARRTKPAFLHNPLREIAVYQSILAESPLGTANYYCSVADAAADRFWLLLERVSGRELYQIGDHTLWQAAARWLARLHCHWAGRVDDVRRRAPVLNYDARFYRTWLKRAVQFHGQEIPTDSIVWRRLVGGYDGIIERLTALPTTFLHGEFYASNVIIDSARKPARVCPIDWEVAAVGPGLMDVAALTAGKWSDDERMALLEAYHNGLEEQGAKPRSLAGLQLELDLCRLHVAVQWLGWSSDWTPPAEHAHDWLGEALELAEKMRL